MLNQKRVVLMVDDQPNSLSEHIDELRERGYEVPPICSDADIAITKFKRFQDDSYAEVDIVVIDMGMPLPKDAANVTVLPKGYTDRHKTGAYLLETLRSWNRVVPIVMYSQLGENDVVNAVWDAYAEGLKSRKRYVPLPPTVDVRRKIEVVQSDFRTWIYFKAAVGPIVFANHIDRIASLLK